MNLRQKVKYAKRELKRLEKDSTSLCEWDMVKKFQHEQKLRAIINRKLKPSRTYHWNESYEIDWSNLTYISVLAEFETLSTLKSPNGKPLKKKEIQDFLNNVFSTKLYRYGIKVSEEKLDLDNVTKRKHVDYCLMVSNDSKKLKRLHIEKIYYQFNGDDKLYAYDKK